MNRTLETVTGAIHADDLGKTLMHEHFLFGYPGYSGDLTLGSLNMKEALETAETIALSLRSFGVETVVDPTPNECGRDPEFLKEVSERTGLQIVCATGYYYEGEGATPYFKFRQQLGTAEEEIYEMFMTELTEGIGATGIKAGILKVASGKNQITPYEEMFFRAAAKAQKETGAVILTHTQEGTMGEEQVDLLLSEGASPDKIVIGHMCGSTDPAYHRRVLEKGVFIGFDRFGIQGMVGAPPDTERIETLSVLLKEGFGDQIMLSHDTVNIWLGRPLELPDPLAVQMRNWHPVHLFENILPKLSDRGFTEEALEDLLTKNPRQLFFQKQGADIV
ncbi:phosphotriesterase-related protein [Bacillus sp. FJAT-42376]|uniref:phosphotriesterase family protein n=1 Tax=Bacillus sp. FJAT-42376 TaxID=2014076 RepID=UPI000F4DD1BC|nr:phosphotriesterase-related protein [Bacillus sp. FJAT-42376]AZB44002.1 phosphotriesterase-related protein [Bacillus sp. FJAT-42376]